MEKVDTKQAVFNFKEAVEAMFIFCKPVVVDGKLYIEEAKAREYLLEVMEWQNKQNKKNNLCQPVQNEESK